MQTIHDFFTTPVNPHQGFSWYGHIIFGLILSLIVVGLLLRRAAKTAPPDDSGRDVSRRAVLFSGIFSADCPCHADRRRPHRNGQLPDAFRSAVRQCVPGYRVVRGWDGSHQPVPDSRAARGAAQYGVDQQFRVLCGAVSDADYRHFEQGASEQHQQKPE